MIRTSLVCIFLFMFLNSCSAEPVLSLRDGWLFSYEEQSPQPVVVPGNWTLHGSGIGPLGYGCYERFVDLSPVRSQAPLMLRIGEIGTACAVYVDDRLLGRRGTFSTREETHVPMVAPLYVALPGDLPNRIKLTIEVSNYEDTNGGGMWGQVLLGSTDQIQTLRNHALIRDSAMAGIFIIVFLFYLILFIYRRKDYALLLFAFICLAFFFRQIATGEKIILLLFPSLSWNILGRMEYLSLYVLAPLYIQFFSVLFGPYRWPHWVTRLFIGFGIIVSLAVLVLPLPQFISTLLVVQFYWLILSLFTFYALYIAVRTGKDDGGFFLFSFSIFVIGALNDILLTRFYVQTLSLVTLAQGVFILTQSFALARRFAREYRHSKNLEELNMHLKELDEARSRFFAAASHELRTPVSLIITPVDAILKGSYGEQLPKDAPVLSLIRRNCERLKHLSEQLLQVLKIDSGMMKPLFQRVDMAAFIQNYMALFSVEAGKKRIRLELALSDRKDRPLLAHTDPVLLETVVLNLLSNAIKFCPTEGRVLIKIETSDKGYVTLCISDTGPGIPTEQQARLFIRFAATADQHPSGIQSFGLGLPLCGEILKLLQGTITVQSEPGKGSSFFVHIPRWQEGQAVQKICEEKPVPPPAHLDLRKISSILIVEDDEDMRMFLQDSLSQECTVHSARSGQEGLEKLQAGLAVDLIISDVLMHPMDGLAFREQVRILPGFDAVPFLFISANPEPEIRFRALETGAVDFIQKPFYIDEFKAKIFALLALMDQKQKRMEDRVLHALRHHESSTQKNKLSWRDRLAFINLTERDEAVLELLLQGLSDKEIASHLHCSVRTVSNRVSSLLKRIGQPSRTALIAFLGQD